jgi:hypothetical protein
MSRPTALALTLSLCLIGCHDGDRRSGPTSSTATAPTSSSASSSTASGAAPAAPAPQGARFAPFGQALLAIERLTLERRAEVEGYDSRTAPFPQGGGAPVIVASNGEASVEGTVVGNVEATGAVFLGKRAAVSGAVSQGAAQRPIPAVRVLVARAQTRNDNARIQSLIAPDGSLSITDDILLPGGTYHVESLIVDGAGTRISTAEPVVIYVAGDVFVDGAGAEVGTGAPADLVIVAAGTSVLIEGAGPDLTLAIYAPDAIVNLAAATGGSFQGAIVGREVLVDDALSYDAALQDVWLPLPPN